MNRRIGIWASVGATITVALFALSMVFSLMSISYATSFLFSWCYLLMTCAFFVKAPKERRVAALAGIAFACVYVTLIGLVYFTQLTTVLYQTESAEVLLALTYTPGRWFFALDLLGYAFLSLSALFVGLTLVPKNKVDKWLKVLLLLHGLYAPACILMPILNVFRVDASGASDMSGVIALMGWCIHFIPIAVLSALHMKNLDN